MEINQKISEIQSELDGNEINKQRKRHLVDELNKLSFYHDRHPEKVECPSPLELYCDMNPDSPECRIHDL